MEIVKFKNGKYGARRKTEMGDFEFITHFYPRPKWAEREGVYFAPHWESQEFKSVDQVNYHLALESGNVDMGEPI